jgi:hypothetical protein
MTEYVYVLTNNSYGENLKIGKTKKSVKERAKELSKETGVLTPFIPVMKIKTNDCTSLEQKIHSHLAPYRTNPKKEFFKISEEELYTKLTEELNLQVIRMGDSDYSSSNSDDDSHDSDSSTYKQLECCTHDIESFFVTASQDPKYDLIRPHPTTEYDKSNKYHENGRPYLVNKLYEYDISGCGLSSTHDYECVISKLHSLRDNVYQRELELSWDNSNRKEYLKNLKYLHDEKRKYMSKQKECQNEDDLNLCKDFIKNIEKRIKNLKEEQRIWNDDNKEWIKLVKKMSSDVKELEEMYKERSQWCDLRHIAIPIKS